MDLNLLFIYFITVNKYRFCISVIGYINVQIIGIGNKKKAISVDHYSIHFLFNISSSTSSVSIRINNYNSTYNIYNE